MMFSDYLLYTIMKCLDWLGKIIHYLELLTTTIIFSEMCSATVLLVWLQFAIGLFTRSDAEDKLEDLLGMK